MACNKNKRDKFLIEIPLLNVPVLVYFGKENLGEYNKLVQSEFYSDFEITEDHDGFTAFANGQGAIYIEDSKDDCCIVHEISHLVDFSLEYTHMYSVEMAGSEIRARTFEFVYKQIMSKR